MGGWREGGKHACLCRGFSLLLERPKMFCVTQYREEKRKEQGGGGGGGGQSPYKGTLEVFSVQRFHTQHITHFKEFLKVENQLNDQLLAPCTISTRHLCIANWVYMVKDEWAWLNLDRLIMGNEAHDLVNTKLYIRFVVDQIFT